LIEIAAGFHPDLTGRENVFLQGAILGMRRDAIARHLDEIVEFAGISAFIDTQVKRYSSGMNARLGFAIAAHLDPEVLIIDEVLSVGDMAFQQRCVERMMAFRREGVAIVFVSHNLQAVGMLCENCLLLERGEPLAIGPTEGVLETYLRAGQGVTTGGQTLTLTVGELETEEGAVASEVSPGMPLRLRIGYRVHAGFHDVTFGFVVYRSTDLLRVYDAHFFSRELGLTSAAAGDEFDLEFAFHAHLTRGHYHIECHVYDNPTQVFLARRSPAAHFAVHETRTWGGVANIDTRARLVGRVRRSEPPVLASPHEAG
jgi:lipopolysaccharide transport system ATP-binding protein